MAAGVGAAAFDAGGGFAQRLYPGATTTSRTSPARRASSSTPCEQQCRTHRFKSLPRLDPRVSPGPGKQPRCVRPKRRLRPRWRAKTRRICDELQPARLPRRSATIHRLAQHQRPSAPHMERIHPASRNRDAQCRRHARSHDRRGRCSAPDSKSERSDRIGLFRRVSPVTSRATSSACARSPTNKSHISHFREKRSQAGSSSASGFRNHDCSRTTESVWEMQVNRELFPARQSSSSPEARLRGFSRVSEHPALL